MTRNQLASKIGHHILDSIDIMKKNKTDFGHSFVVPIILDRKSDKYDWLTSVTIAMPSFMRQIFKNGKYDFERITMAQYYGWKKKAK